MLRNPTLIVVCGWPVSGKSTIARLIQKQLGVHFVDIDEVRRLCVGLPYPHPEESQELMKNDAIEMRAAYKILFYTAELHLRQGRAIIINPTLSRRIDQKEIADIVARNLSVLKIIQCLPKNDSREEIEKRLTRKFGEDYFGTVNSYERYLEVKGRYQPIELPHFEIDTSPPNTAEVCAEAALNYILS